MINIQVSIVLKSIAGLLEIKGENSFKIRAYKQAAEAIENLQDDLSIICRDGNLENIEGIGKGIGKKVEEIINTGRSSYLEELQKAIPQGLLKILSIPGVGPKKARLFQKHLGIETLEALKDACSKRELRKLPGIGAKLEFNILKAIKKFESAEVSLSLATAQPVVLELIHRLKSNEKVAKISVSGDLRRRGDKLTTARIVVGTVEQKDIINYLSDFIDILQVEELSAGEYRLIYTPNIPIEIVIAKPQDFSSVLWLDTGSPEHCELVLERIKELHKKTKKNINHPGSKMELLSCAGKNEVDFYKAAAMQYVVPELRENSGEIDAAINRTLPVLIEPTDVKGDLHVHTRWSDGGNTIQEMAEAAMKLGYEYIGICDHSKSLKVAGGLREKELMKQVEEIRRINQKLSGIRVLAGTEVDIMGDGKLDFSDKFLKELDLVVASIHTGFNQDRNKITRRLEKAMENQHVDIIAHPTGRILGRRPGYEVDMDKLLQKAKEAETILEINSYPDRLDLNHEFACKCKEMGIKIAINTDAHSIEQMKHIGFGLGVARKGWLEKNNVVNTHSYKDLPF